jgi:iron(II)-dependent oxidoreductase
VRGVQEDETDQLATLESTRARTLELVAPLCEADLVTQHSALMSPLAWDLGHIAEFEAEWLLRGPDKELGVDLASLYDPMATPRAGRAELALPPVATVFERLHQVRRAVHAHLPSASDHVTLPAGEFSLPLVIQHELQHQETMLQAIALREDLEYRPGFVRAPPTALAECAASSRVLVPGGSFVMGTDDRQWAYDNERPAHEHRVPSFLLERSPVNNGAYLAFMADGGYRRRELWSPEGWAWLEHARGNAPAHWRRVAAGPADTLGSWAACVFGRLEPLHPAGIVSHVCWYEADAYARWAGGRLPTEAEWEKAAAWDASNACSRRYPWGDSTWNAARANLAQERLAPARDSDHPEGRSAYGCLQMLGDVWEWTDTWFDGYPGFQIFPYPEYSQVFFGQRYRVLRGGSFATSPLVARNTFRNWDFAERRQIFAGFRCAWPA